MRVELTCFLYNKKHEEMGVKSDDIEAKITIDMELIEFVRQRADEGEFVTDKKTCMIGLKSGDGFVIGNSYEKMLELWNQK